MTEKTSISAVVREHELLNNPSTLSGMESLLARVAPLVAAGRFDNIVDLLSAVSDVVNMADNAMVEKLAHDYENLASAAFKINGVMRHASDQAAAQDDLPTLWQTMRRLNRDEDARRGLLMIVNMLALLGRDVRYSREMSQAGDS